MRVCDNCKKDLHNMWFAATGFSRGTDLQQKALNELCSLRCLVEGARKELDRIVKSPTYANEVEEGAKRS